MEAGSEIKSKEKRPVSVATNPVSASIVPSPISSGRGVGGFVPHMGQFLMNPWGVVQGNIPGVITPSLDVNLDINVSMGMLMTDPRTVKIIDAMAEKRYEQKLREISCRTEPPEIDDAVAESMIKDLLIRFGEAGKTNVDVLDIVYELGLEPEQITRIMDRLMGEEAEHE